MIKRLAKLHSELGTLPTLSYLCGETLARCSRNFDLHHYKFYAQPTLDTQRVSEQRRSRYEFEWLDAYAEILDQLGRPHHIIESRFAQGAKCLIVKQDNNFLACLWLVESKYIEDEIRATYYFPGNSAWDFDVFVTPKKRLTPLFAILWDLADIWMNERNINYSLSRISAHNHNSLRAHEAAGARPIGWALAIKLNDWQFAVSSHTPKFHLSRSAKDSGPGWHFDLS